ncbi:Protein of unknown function [Noviherbaspirillum humi]|uniref:DUF2891 domain-containing protein n=1 Tax=Noviherbaspirillum humi TaxID=1688639 RepID=A0A239L8L5_9BURK|nr:DUF2891 domain-containing protein [Noviherbaspirillum humi]SNT26977.1 Protein of unknown function [Noviherbaspirillum humi]
MPELFARPFGPPDRHALLAANGPTFARIALANIVREYPNKLDHVLTSPDDLQPPRQLHPVFYGSFDWHSAVHMHWLLARLLRRGAAGEAASAIPNAFDTQFTPDRIAGEISYLNRPSARTFERTYGWAWLLKLQAELIALASEQPEAERWRDVLQPLADAFAQRYLDFLPLATFPIRAGIHANSAFGLLLALDYAGAHQDLRLRQALIVKGHEWFGRDRRYPAAYEPGGDDFLSGGLCEAALMCRLLDGCDFADWWEQFCPPPLQLAAWLAPVPVSDRSDPKLAHLDGLNLARAWCWRLLLPSLTSPLRETAEGTIEAHLQAALPHALAGDYAGTHWLASFAALALSE